MIEDNPNWACMQPWYGYAIAEYILRTLVPASPLNVSEHRTCFLLLWCDGLWDPKEIMGIAFHATLSFFQVGNSSEILHPRHMFC
jgi:hypothetical protein